MKKLIFSFVFLFSLSSLFAQVTYFRTKNSNIGFGTSSDVAGNKYMDFCVNGPLMGSDNNPVGGYVDNGVTTKEWVIPENGRGNFSTRNGIFGCTKAGQLFLVREKTEILGVIRWAFQNGPILVENGVNVCGTSQSQFSRSGIGYRADNTIIVIVSVTPKTFYEFAQLFIDEGCTNAIYLDGGPTYCGYANKKGSYGMNPNSIKLQFFNN